MEKELAIVGKVGPVREIRLNWMPFRETRFPTGRHTQRRFLATHYQTKSWAAVQTVVIKVEVHAQGTNRQVVVTNRPGWHVLPAAVYDAYDERGESENRNKGRESKQTVSIVGKAWVLLGFYNTSERGPVSSAPLRHAFTNTVVRTLIIDEFHTILDLPVLF